MAAPVQHSTETTEPQNRTIQVTEENVNEQNTLQPATGEIANTGDDNQPQQYMDETPIEFTRWTVPPEDQVIKIRSNAFDFKANGTRRTASAASTARSAAVKSLVKAIEESAPTKEQQGLALRLALLHADLRALCFSAGIHVSAQFFAEQYIMENIRSVVTLAMKTEKKRGRATDDLRSLVHSLVLASLPRPEEEGQQPTTRQLAKAIGLSKSSYHRIMKDLKSKRAALEVGDRHSIFSQVVRRKGHTKVGPVLKKDTQTFVRNHPHVVTSPIANDLVTVKDEGDPTKTIKTAKLLLQISVRELHNDLIAQLPQATSPDGDVLVSDYKLRQIMPPEVRPMTNRYKTMCGCIACLSMKYYQSDFNYYKAKLLDDLEKKVHEAAHGSDARRIANARYTVYRNEARPKESVKEATYAIQCKLCDDDPVDAMSLQFDGLTRMRCAYGNCDDCPKPKLTITEAGLTEEDPWIWVHRYQTVTTCSDHGALPEGSTECIPCSRQRDGEARGKVSRRRQLTNKRMPFPRFYKDFYLPTLLGYRKHRFKFILLSKNHTGMDRANIQLGEVLTHRDFSERLTLKFNHAAQLDYYGGGACISLEGVLVSFIKPDDQMKTMEFHSFFSDGKQQDSAVVMNHMEKMVGILKSRGVLKDGGHIYCHTDGCAAQYRCGTAFYYMSALAYKHKITVDRFISAPGHGKSSVDGISGKTKTLLTLATARENKTAAEAELQDVKKFNPAVMLDGRLVSAAEECVRMLEIDGTTGAKSNRKSNKREESRGIREMHNHVRHPSERLAGLKYGPPDLPKESGGVSEQYHIYCCHEMGLGKVAFRKIPCACTACKSTIKRPWVPRLVVERQPRFQAVPDCKYNEIVGEDNKWYFSDLKQRTVDSANHYEYMDEDADLYRKEVREHISAVVAEEIHVGGVGAVVTTDPKADGFYLVEWTDTPFTCQETGELKCCGKYFNRVGRTTKWYTKSDLADEHLVQHIVLGDVRMEPISDSNPLPNTCNKGQATRLGAMKISGESYDFIFDETWRRERLEDPEYDRSDDEADDSEEDSDSELE